MSTIIAQHYDQYARKCNQRSSSCERNFHGSHEIVTNDRLYPNIISRQEMQQNYLFQILSPEYANALPTASKEFIEQRRRALKRCLTQIARHPTLYEDRIVVFFLTVKTSVSHLMSNSGLCVNSPLLSYSMSAQFLVCALICFSTLWFGFCFQDVGQKLKDQFKMMPDEFMTSPLASRARV